MINTIGRRKSSVARIYMYKGKGDIQINGKDIKDYFPQMHIQNKVHEPFDAITTDDKFDLKIRVNGGGIKGQAEAIRMGIARALVDLDAEFRSPLKERKLLTRDSRAVERKKYGKPKARKNFQFSKR